MRDFFAVKSTTRSAACAGPCALTDAASYARSSTVTWTGGPHVVYMVTVDKCKFRKPARPGDVIEYHIRKIRRRSAMGWYEARAMVGSTLIAEAEVGAMVMAEP